jgi:hypothetical protein
LSQAIFFPGSPLEPAAIPTAQVLSFRLQYFPYYVISSSSSSSSSSSCHRPFFPRSSSWTSGDPHRSGVKFQTAILSVLWYYYHHHHNYHCYY